MEELRKVIGENLAELRKEKKLTQIELAEHFNYSDKTISKWEKGDILPDIETLYRLCEFYGVTLDYLTHEGDKTEKNEFIKEDFDRKKRNSLPAPLYRGDTKNNQGIRAFFYHVK